MNLRTCLILCSLLLLAPLSVHADAGGGGNGGGGDNPWNKQVNPQQVKADYDAGYQQLKAGDYKAAIKSFKRVIDADSNHAMAYTNMAYSYRKLGDYKRSVSLYQKALKIEPNLPEAHEYMGEALLELGKVEEAKKHLAILEKLDPKMAEGLRTEIARRDRS
jgi:tetratricopeptide (TPR) repeat protein